MKYGKRKGEIVYHQYDPNWKKLFECEAELLRTTLCGKYRSIIHVGGTSIEGMVANSIIDISIAVNEIQDWKYYHETLSSIGYEHDAWSKYNLFFHKYHEGQRYHLYLEHHESDFLFKQVLFKIYFEKHSNMIEKYSRQKEALLFRHGPLFYKLERPPYISIVYTWALIDILRSPNYWRKRINEEMGYIPFPELFSATPELMPEEQIWGLFENCYEGEEYHKEFLDQMKIVNFARIFLRENWSLKEISKVTALSISELEDIGNIRHNED